MARVEEGLPAVSFKIIQRGAPRPIAQEFRCPQHGVFTAIVDSGTERASCPHVDSTNLLCATSSPWSPSRAPVMRMRRVEATKGKSETAEHPEWNFQRNLEEGQDFDDWEADREKAAEERCKQIVIDAVRSER